MLSPDNWEIVNEIRRRIDQGMFDVTEKIILDSIETRKRRLSDLERRRREYLRDWNEMRNAPVGIGVDGDIRIFRMVFSPRPTFPLGSEYEELMKKIREELELLEELRKLHAYLREKKERSIIGFQV
jgi:hypothetical protein